MHVRYYFRSINENAYLLDEDNGYIITEHEVFDKDIENTLNIFRLRCGNDKYYSFICNGIIYTTFDNKNLFRYAHVNRFPNLNRSLDDYIIKARDKKLKSLKK